MGQFGSSCGAEGPEPDTRRPSRCGRVSRELPYLAGEPARTWHLTGSTPVGCRGFNGPVPPPLLISTLQLWVGLWLNMRQRQSGALVRDDGSMGRAELVPGP